MNITSFAKLTDIKREWVAIDASKSRFGQLISEISKLLIGKHKPYYTPHLDCGDYVVIVNASDVNFSGSKLEKKTYYNHTGYFGGIKSEKLEDLLKNKPQKLYHKAVRGMLPKTNLGKQMLKKLKVYQSNEHPHMAQLKDNKEKVKV